MSQVPQLQIALDQTNLQDALKVVQLVQQHIDIIEVGTLLCLSEGMNAIRTMRILYPQHTIVGDVRIVRAGSKIAKMVFDAGADWVTVVAEAPSETIEASLKVANDYQGEIQLELGESIDLKQLSHWRDLGLQQVIFHSESEVNDNGTILWPEQSLGTVKTLCDAGFRVTVTGGIKPETVTMFAGLPVAIIIAGRAIWNAQDPLQATKTLKQAMQGIYG